MTRKSTFEGLLSHDVIDANGSVGSRQRVTRWLGSGARWSFYAVGPQAGYFFKFGAGQGYINLRGTGNSARNAVRKDGTSG